MTSHALTTAVLAAALAAGGCAAAEPRPAVLPAGPPPSAVKEPEPLPREQAKRPAGETARLELQAPAGTHPLIWVRHGAEVELRTEPGGGELIERVGRRTEFDSPRVYGVIREADGWAGVTTPLLPNGELAWVELDPRRLKAAWTSFSIAVDLSERRAQLLRRGRVVRSFAISVGMPGSETPTGRFAVTDTFRGDLNPVYGCCALALSATQPHLPSGWLGGNRIAIHGTTSPLGMASSHGCVRAADADVSELVDRVPLGSPVVIRP